VLAILGVDVGSYRGRERGGLATSKGKREHGCVVG
jgi:hypothetical protein